MKRWLICHESVMQDLLCKNSLLPSFVPGDLEETGQEKAVVMADAADFITKKLANIAMKVNQGPTSALSLIIRTCAAFHIEDKDHIAYILTQRLFDSNPYHSNHQQKLFSFSFPYKA
jgi:hypothetical protein